jgi:hypothetical protein
MTLTGRNPRLDPIAGDMLRKQSHLDKWQVIEVISRDRYGIRYKADGTLQSSVDVKAWQQWANGAEVIHMGDSL